MSEQHQLISRYCDYLERVGKSANTVRAYGRDVADFADWFAGTYGEAFHPQAVDSRDVQDYRGYLQNVRGLKPATVNRRLIALRRFFQWARREEHVTHSPFEILENVLVKEQNDTSPRWLDRNEQRALVRAARRSKRARDVAIIQTLLGTGLRISELVGLNVSDVEISERKGSLYVRGGKGSKARTLPLDKRTRHALSAYLDEREEEDDERLFLGQRGPLHEPGVHYLVKKYAYQAKLEDCTSHTLRHTFAKNLVDAGTPLD